MRRVRDSGAKVDSFAFLNVMVGMIVVLLLFLFFILATRTMDTIDAGYDVGAAATPDVGQGTASPSSAEGQGEGDLDEELFNDLQRQLIETSTQVAARRQRLDEIVRIRQELETLIQSKEDEVALAVLDSDEGESGVVLGLPTPAQMIPDDSIPITKRPRYVEVTADTYVVHDDGGATVHSRAQLATKNSPLQQFLKRVDDKRANEYLLLLIHPNGGKAYKDLRNFLSENYFEQVPIGGNLILRRTRIGVGVEPFSSEWLLIKGKMPN